MEYLQGPLLSEALRSPLAPGKARLLVRQLAEGLYAAHQKGVVHGDFKPANIIVVPGEGPRAVIMDFGLARALDRTTPATDKTVSLRAGTVDYMAPELQAGSPPTVRSDIFAFGRVAQALMPKERYLDECTRPVPEQRLGSLDPIIKRLSPQTTRRFWMMGAVLASAGAISYSVWPPARRLIALPASARLLVNGFRAISGPVVGARLARSLLLTALRQSPHIRAISDQDLIPTLRRLKPDATLPLAGQLLHDLLTLLRAAFWVDADLQQHGSRYSLNLRLLRASDQGIVTESDFRDVPGIAALAQQAALWLRDSAGESRQSIAANPVTVASYTSQVPEALEKYYDAMEHYAVAEMELAIPLLEEAVRLDPNFAQAYSMLGMAINPSGRYEEAFQEVERAVQLAAHLPERERAWIESNYYRLSEDPVKMIAAAHRDIAYYPDEPRFYRTLAHDLCQIGDARESVQYSRKAVELAPADDLQKMDLIDSLSEAGRFEEALQEFQNAVGRGVQNRWIYISGGTAYMGLERYREALAAFEMEPEDRGKNLDMQGARVLQGNLEGALAALQEQRAGARNAVEAHQADEFLCGLYFLTDRLPQARRHVGEMADLPAYPPMSRLLDATAFWAFRLGDDATLSKTHACLAQVAARWPNAFTRAVELHARALEAWRRQSSNEAESLFLESSGLAFSVWTAFDIAEFYAAHSKPDLAEDYWHKVDDHRGNILEHWFPGSLIMLWLGRALTAQARNDRAAAYRYSRKVLDHWSESNPGLRVVLMARGIHAANKPT